MIYNYQSLRFDFLSFAASCNSKSLNILYLVL